MLDSVALNPQEACSVLIGPSCATGYNPYDQPWNVTLPNVPKPPVTPVPPPKVRTCCYTVAMPLLCCLLCCCYTVAMPLLCCCYAVAMPLLCCCYAVAMPLLCCCYAVAMPLLCCCYAVAMPLLCCLLCCCFSCMCIELKLCHHTSRTSYVTLVPHP